MPTIATFGSAAARSFGFSSGPYIAPPGQILYDTAGVYTWTVPPGVYSVSVVSIGGGGGGHRFTSYARGGAGGGLAWKNDIPVTPGGTVTITVGARGTPSITNSSANTATPGGFSSFETNAPMTYVGVTGFGGGAGFYAGSAAATRPAGGGAIATASPGGTRGTYTGGYGGWGYAYAGGGGGAAGYQGNGGNACVTTTNTYGQAGNAGAAGGGGGGGGGSGGSSRAAGAGGGVGWKGMSGNSVTGSGGAAYTSSSYNGWCGTSGSGGLPPNTALQGTTTVPTSATYISGGEPGGGGAASDNSAGGAGSGGRGIVRIMWTGTGSTRAYPATNTQDM